MTSDLNSPVFDMPPEPEFDEQADQNRLASWLGSRRDQRDDE
jgi:hypothetical protein